MLFGRIDGDIALARAIASIIVVPFIAVSTARNTGWAIEMHMSRGAVFHTTALFLSGAFVLAVAGAGYIIRYFGGDWGRALSIELVFAALLLGALVIGSGRFRARLKVFVSKHFFSYRYDYREEWLRFTRTLSTESAVQSMQQRIIMALADLVESPCGALWLADATRGFVPSARWNLPQIDAVEADGGSLPSFLQRTGWVVNLPQYASEPERYPGLVLPAWLSSLAGAWLVVPLASTSELMGFVVLTKPRTEIDVDWEVHDLLKTASRQAASYLGEIRASEALLEARKFAAFNRMSAFVVHDLKNLIAQLALVLKNAERHRHNPRFQSDMVSTVQHVAERMGKLLSQLGAAGRDEERLRPLELGGLAERVVRAKATERADIALHASSEVLALAHEQRLERVLGHLVQNAIDATREGGSVGVTVRAEAECAVVEVHDAGCGMPETFVREQLFRPFQSTKAAGMGLGAYEAAQYMKELGGRIDAESRPGAGTRIRLLLPRYGDALAGAQPLTQAA
jgi:putative PEP-CTERM system histidine kinase